MSEFAATFISARLVARAAQDELALSVLTGMISTVEYYEGQTDAELAEWAANHRKSWSLLVAEGDYDDAGEHEYEEQVIWSVLNHRQEQAANARATAFYMADRAAGLTHNPFEALLDAFAVA